MTTTMLEQVGEPAVVGAPAIVARHLTKRFGDLTAVDDLSFEVQPGRVTGFLGPNGAGKSTTLRMVLGLVTPTSGTAAVLGLPYASLADPAGTVGAVLETQSFHPLRTGRNHLRVLTAASGIDDGRVEQVLAQVDLAAAADRKAGTYSLGMRQRLGLAAALLGDPGILVLDEPANGLDPQGIRWLRDFLRSFAARGRAVLVSSHLLAEMAQLADDLIVIHHGRSIRQGPVAALTTGADTVRVATPRADTLMTALSARGITVEVIDGTSLRVQGATAEQVGQLAFDAGAPVFELTTEATSLEDAFLDLTKEEER